MQLCACTCMPRGYTTGQYAGWGEGGLRPYAATSPRPCCAVHMACQMCSRCKCPLTQPGCCCWLQGCCHQPHKAGSCRNSQDRKHAPLLHTHIQSLAPSDGTTRSSDSPSPPLLRRWRPGGPLLQPPSHSWNFQLEVRLEALDRSGPSSCSCGCRLILAPTQGPPLPSGRGQPLVVDAPLPRRAGHRRPGDAHVAQRFYTFRATGRAGLPEDRPGGVVVRYALGNGRPPSALGR
jgi:hypothetical protein